MARTPLYQAAETEMIARITRGDWEVGRRLPNEFQLAEEFGVSQGTMRRALISLEGMGYLNRKPGRGTLVASQAAALAAAPALTPVLLTAEGKPLKLVPFRGRTEVRSATTSEAKTMDTARVHTIERTLKVGRERAAMDAIAVPEALVDGLDEDAPVDLAAFLEHHGLTPARLSAEARAEITDMSQSVALSVDRYTPLLVVRFAAFDAAGKVIARQIQRVAHPGAQLSHQ